MMLVWQSNIYPQNTYTFINHFISLHYDCFYSYKERVHKNLIHFNIYVFIKVQTVRKWWESIGFKKTLTSFTVDYFRSIWVSRCWCPKSDLIPNFCSNCFNCSSYPMFRYSIFWNFHCKCVLQYCSLHRIVKFLTQVSVLAKSSSTQLVLSDFLSIYTQKPPIYNRF